jgi:hypothetical protein
MPSLLTTTRATHSRKTSVMFRKKSSQQASNVLAAIINGFGELLQWGGALSDDGDRWVWEAGDIQEVKDEPSAPTTKKRRGAGSTTSSEPPWIFLVADGPNRNTKYLMALAAGIPCVE